MLANKRVVFTAALMSVLLVGVLPTTPAWAAKDLEGHGGIGGSLGWIGFTSGDRLSRGNVRPIFRFLTFYNLTNTVALEGNVGFGWNAYPNNGTETVTLPSGADTTVGAPSVAVVSPWTIGAQVRRQLGESSLFPHAGVGVGAYILDVRENYRKTVDDAVTGDKMRWVSPGFYMKFGGEIVWDTGAALTIDFLYHSIFSEDDRFANGWATNTSFLEMRVGGIYYFNLGGGSGAVPEADGD